MTPTRDYLPDKQEYQRRTGPVFFDDEAQRVVESLKGATPAQRAEIWNVLTGRAIPEIQERTALRWLQDGTDVLLDVNGVQVAPYGSSYASRINLRRNLRAAWQSRPDQVELVIDAIGGGGLDCMADYIVSDCLAQAIIDDPGIFSEGMTITSATGCPVILYSTITATLAAIDVLASGDSSTVFICHGVYDEGDLELDAPSAGALHLIGSGSGNTVVRPTGSQTNVFTVTNIHSDDNAVTTMTGITVDTSQLSGTGHMGIAGSANMRFKLFNCTIETATGDFGFVFENGGGGTELTLVNFTGSGTGCYELTGNEMDAIVDCCHFEDGLAVGIDLDGADTLQVTSCHFACTIGISAHGTGVGHLVIVGNLFKGASGVVFAGTSSANFGDLIVGNRFDCSTVGLSFSGMSGVSPDRVFLISANIFHAAGGSRIGIAGHATKLANSVITSNLFFDFTSGNEMQNVSEAAAQNNSIGHNVTNSGATLPDTHDTLLAAVFAPIGADYLVGTANASLTNEIVAGTTPGGELGGTWASPTVDATHSGSAHHDAITLAADADSILGLSTQQITLDSQNANTVFAGPTSGGAADPTFRALVAADIPVATVFSVVDYVFVPDAAPGDVITAGDAQGNIYHSGPSNETAIKLFVDAETAPGASGLPFTAQFGDTDDLDTVGSWTTIATLTLSSEKSSATTSMSQATITAGRLIRGNWGTIVGSPADATATLRCKRALSV